MRYLITGGAGFIGINAAYHYATRGDSVTIFDNFSRPGTEQNLVWLMSRCPHVRVITGDIRYDLAELNAAAAQCDVLLHLAAQVAVTTSVNDPEMDFEVNARGTLNVLEAARGAGRPPIVLYSSTNKVYGAMEDVAVACQGRRYYFPDLPHGIPESRTLDFHSPYGCSKGAADQYVHDYARIYGLRTVVFRQSCIYGLHQFGIEDQGWLAWFTMRHVMDLPVTIYGDGKQVRDVLDVQDLIEVYDAAVERIDRVAGNAYNIGGGPGNTLSLLELTALLEELGQPLSYSFADWRPGDQRVYISDIGRAAADLGWQPKTTPIHGIRMLRHWMIENQETIEQVYGYATLAGVT